MTIGVLDCGVRGRVVVWLLLDLVAVEPAQLKPVEHSTPLSISEVVAPFQSMLHLLTFILH